MTDKRKYRTENIFSEPVGPLNADDHDGFDLLLREKALERALAGLVGLPIEKIVAALAAGFGAHSDAFKRRVADLIAAGCLSDDDRAFVDSISNLDDNGRDEFDLELRASLKAEIKPNAATRAAMAEADEIAKSRRARLTIDTGDDTAAAIAATKMDPRHASLNALIDDNAASIAPTTETRAAMKEADAIAAARANLQAEIDLGEISTDDGEDAAKLVRRMRDTDRY